MYEFGILPGQPKVTVTLGKDGRVTEDGDSSGERVTLEKFSMGAMKGFEMALADLESQGIKLQPRDKVTITCTGTQPSQKGDDMVLFSLDIER